MEHIAGPDPALTISFALVAGLLAQTVGHHLRIPGIVMLLGAGALLGPDVLGLVEPASLGTALPTLVGFAVAVILFEGGLNLDIRRLERESHTIQRLITLGALITAVGATAAARGILGWEWRPAILFGTLVIVTGPTVVGPLVRRIRLKKSLQTVLEGEGILIDPIGAILSVVALDVALQPSMPSLARGVVELAASLGLGVAAGLAGGAALTWLLKRERFLPEGLENVFALSAVLALFHACNRVQPESGIAAVTVAGVLVGNRGTRVGRDLKEFKEQLTVMFIGMLFVILAADVRFAEIRALGVPGLVTVVALMIVVRPLNVLACTIGSDLTTREKLFLAWIAPRGIVAAAVASYFALEMERAGVAGGSTLRAMVFLVILVTVTAQGLTGGLLARALSVSRGPNRGWAILGANGLGRAVAGALRDHGEDVFFFDSNADASHEAESEGFRVVFGNALAESTLLRAGIDRVAGCIGLTPNEEVNLLFASRNRREFKIALPYATLHQQEGHVTPAMVRSAGASILFGAAIDFRLWEACARHGVGERQAWEFVGKRETPAGEGSYVPATLAAALLPVVQRRGDRVRPFDDRATFRPGDVVTFLVYSPRTEEVGAWLHEHRWRRAEVAEAPTEEPAEAQAAPAS